MSRKLLLVDAFYSIVSSNKGRTFFMPDELNRSHRVSALPIHCHADQTFAVAYLTGNTDAAQALHATSDSYLHALELAGMSPTWRRRIAVERARRAASNAPAKRPVARLVARLLRRAS